MLTNMSLAAVKHKSKPIWLLVDGTFVVRTYPKHHQHMMRTYFESPRHFTVSGAVV